MNKGNASFNVGDTADEGEEIERIGLRYVNPNGDPEGNENVKRIPVSSLDELKAAVAFMENQKNRNADNEESTTGPCNSNRKHELCFDDGRELRAYSSDAMMESGKHFIDRMHTSKQAFLDEVKRFELFRSVIQHEDDLLNQRVSWIILAQSFLMAAFITNTSNDGSGNSLKYITATVGLLTVVVTLPAILAAGRNIELQQHVYFARISSEQRCRELHGHGRYIVKGIVSGDDTNNVDMKTEHKERAQFGHIFPNMAFRGRGAMSILNTVIALAVVQVVGWILLLIALVNRW